MFNKTQFKIFKIKFIWMVFVTMYRQSRFFKSIYIINNKFISMSIVNYIIMPIVCIVYDIIIDWFYNYELILYLYYIFYDLGLCLGCPINSLIVWRDPSFSGPQLLRKLFKKIIYVSTVKHYHYYYNTIIQDYKIMKY